MKPVKNFVLAVLFVFAIAITTPAGVQDTPGYVPPPPPTATSNSDEYTASGDSDTDQTGDVTAETSDYLLFEALAALLTVY